MSVSPSYSVPVAATDNAPAHNREARNFDQLPAAENELLKILGRPADKKNELGWEAMKKELPVDDQFAFAKGVIYGGLSAPAPDSNFTHEEQGQRIDAYAERVVDQIKDMNRGEEGERNIRFQQVRKFLEPTGYFSGGLLAAGFDPLEKITVKFTTYVGVGNSKVLSNTDQRTYYAWEIAAGAFAHDKVDRGGPINFHYMEIEPKDRSKIKDLEHAGKKLQDYWSHKVFDSVVVQRDGGWDVEGKHFKYYPINPIASAMQKKSDEIAERSGKADAYTTKGILESLRSDKPSFEKLTPEGQEAVTRSLERNGQIIIPNIYGYPLERYAFVPYTIFYSKEWENRPNHGLMIDLANGAVSEIHGDNDFARWAKDNHETVRQRFNAEDRQGGKDAHWPKAGDVLDNLISGNNAHYPGRYNALSDQSVPVSQTFNYTSSRGSDYQLKYGSLNDGIAKKYQDMNEKNAIWADQTEVFGALEQSWKEAKSVWGNTLGYVPLVGNFGNIVFGIYDGVYGMTADDRVGGNSAAVISGLQLAHEIAPLGVEAALGETAGSFNSSGTQHYGWRHNPKTSEFEFVRVSNIVPEVISTPQESLSFPGMRKVTFKGKEYFAAESPDAGDGVHYLLRVPDPEAPSKLASSGIIAAPDELGTWKRMGVEGGGSFSEIFSQKYRGARKEVQSVMKLHKRAEAAERAKEPLPVTPKEAEEFTKAMVKIIGESNAAEFELVNEYIHAKTNFVNRPLRAGLSTPKLERFLNEFKQLKNYDGKAYRSAFVTPEGASRIKDGVGKVFHDPGVQSASAAAKNSFEWGGWAKDVVVGRENATQKVVYIFDETIPKKNLSTEFLKDHLAIGPGQPLKILAVEEQGEKLFVYLSAPSEVPAHLYNIYDGSQVY